MAQNNSVFLASIEVLLKKGLATMEEGDTIPEVNARREKIK